MMAISLSSIPKLQLNRRFSTRPSAHNKKGIMKARKLVVNAQKDEDEDKSFEENLFVLRMRIKKIKSIEAIKDQDHQKKLPSETETKSLSHYHVQDVFEVVELLKSYFAKTRPDVALGVIVLLTMSLPLISQTDILANVLKVAKVLLGGGRVCIDIDF
ncbi:hypothetical protein CASFOL_018222 [Castilleja foliolosa]|uniref:Uncharacterized protein n=1 Tax=Castilleja foliolosa TaxID=1961234 RepID=A0ABD3D962_9LAMI